MIVYGTWYGSLYDRFAKPWEASVYRACPGATVIGERSRPPASAERIYRRCGGHVTGNTHKLGLWVKAAENAAKMGEPLVLMDVDTIVLRDLREAFDAHPNFDVAYTVRDYKIGFNAGVVFLRPTPGAVAFMRQWHAHNSAVVSAARNRRQAIAEGRGTGRNYGGANQLALSRLLKSPPPNCNIETLPCNVWNSVDQTWDDFGPHTAVVHLKGDLRAKVLLGTPGNPTGTPIERILHAYQTIEAGVAVEGDRQEVAAC